MISRPLKEARKSDALSCCALMRCYQEEGFRENFSSSDGSSRTKVSFMVKLKLDFNFGKMTWS